MTSCGLGPIPRSTPVGLVRDIGGRENLDDRTPDPESVPPVTGPRPPMARAGDVIDGKYRLDRILGEGGMGVVFGGVHLALETPIALKCLRPELLGDAQALGRFVQEARLAASIAHEHSTRIYDVGTTREGMPFIVMEHLEGQSLDERLTQHGPLPVGAAVTIVLQTLAVLAEAHAKGLVHRDLKPGNLFLQDRADGALWVKVMDFGISKPIGPSSSSVKLTEPRSLLGSPQYMSPEQLRDSSTVDHRSDIWSMGVVLFELLTGTVPFDAPSLAELFGVILDDEAPSLRKVRGDVPPGLEDVVRAMLAKDPASRPQTVGDVALRLAPFAPDAARTAVARIHAVCLRAERARSQSARVVVERRPRPSSGNLRSAAFGVLAVLAAGAIAYALAPGAGPSTTPPPAADDRRTSPSLVPSVAPSASANEAAAAPVLPEVLSASANVASAPPAAASAPRPKAVAPAPPTSPAPPTTRIRRPSQIQPVD